MQHEMQHARQNSVFDSTATVNRIVFLKYTAKFRTVLSYIQPPSSEDRLILPHLYTTWPWLCRHGLPKRWIFVGPTYWKCRNTSRYYPGDASCSCGCDCKTFVHPWPCRRSQKSYIWPYRPHSLTKYIHPLSLSILQTIHWCKLFCIFVNNS